MTVADTRAGLADKIRRLKARRQRQRRRWWWWVTAFWVAVIGFMVAFALSTLAQAALWKP